MQFTDRHLIVFTILATFVVLGSVGLIVYRFDQSGIPITGFATSASGSVNVSIQSTIAISFSNSSLVEFGNGSLSDPITKLNTTSISTTVNPGGFSKPGPFVILNDGNTCINVTVNGTIPSTFLGTGASFEYAGQAETAACGSANLTTARVNFTAVRTQVCGQLNYSNPTDTMNLSIAITILTSTATSGVKTATVEVGASQVTSSSC